ncbi:energy transducer TonB [Acidithiobacillus ferrianus]|uniref:Energy transducer TonB n=1 Tax=Acidithiobacillus ferrianus TaxID=2678518 RepID=A0ACD5H574_9PROT|nr:energy transducer TonB [Acidithiobacillus ferrianus]
MNAATLSSPVQSPKFKKDHCGRALMIGGLIYSHLSQPVTVKPKPKIMAIHMIKPAPPKPLPVPRPKPIPRPVPHPVVHHPLPPKPLLAKTPAACQSAIDIYTTMLRAWVQANAHVPDFVRMMHVGGTYRDVLSPDAVGASAFCAGCPEQRYRRHQPRRPEDRGGHHLSTLLPKKMSKHPMMFDVSVHLSAHSRINDQDTTL